MKVTLQLHSGPATCEFWDGKEWGIIKTERGEPVCGCQLLREELEGHTLYLLTISTATVHMPSQKATGPVYFESLHIDEHGEYEHALVRSDKGPHLFLEGGEYTFAYWDGGSANIPFGSPDTEHALWGPQNVDTRELPTQDSKWWIKQEGKAIEEWEDDSRTFGGWFNPRGTLKKGDDPGGDGIQIFEGAWRKKTAHNLREAIRIAQRTRTCAVDLETGRPLTVEDFAENGVQPFNVYAGTYQRIPALEAVGALSKPWNHGTCSYEQDMLSWKHHDGQHYVRSVEFLPELLTWAREDIVRKWAARTLELRLNHLRFCAPEIPQAKEPHNSLHAALKLNRDKPHQLGNGGPCSSMATLLRSDGVEVPGEGAGKGATLTGSSPLPSSQLSPHSRTGWRWHDARTISFGLLPRGRTRRRSRWPMERAGILLRSTKRAKA